MARRQSNEVLYKVFKNFLKLCLLENHSLLWPDKDIWTPERVKETKKRMVDSPIMGHELSFEEKLEKQLVGGSPELWGIISDIYYVYFLPSTNITLGKKQKDIRWAAEKGGLTPPPDNSDIWEAQKCGFTRTTLRYHQKYAQFWLILYFSNHLKGLEKPNEILEEPQEMQRSLDMIIENIPNKSDRAYDMRHAMLYMAFPELYERIISTRDKEKILEKFKNKISGTVPFETDEAIRQIRKSLSGQYDKPDRPFDFYQDLKEEWKPGKDPIIIDGETGPVTVPEEKELPPDIQEIEEATEHTQIQWMLLKLGNDMGLDVWVAKNDRNRGIGSQKFSDLPHFKKDIPLTFDEATNRTIQLIDVLWIKGNMIKAAFEIESTTSIYSGILRLADLISMQPHINIPLFLVAPDERRKKVIEEVNRPVFSKLSPAMSQACRFIPFTALREQIPKIASVVEYLNPSFLEKLSESCEIDGE